MRARDLGMLLLLAAIWGASYLFIRVASSPLGPLVLMEGRVVVASAAPCRSTCARIGASIWCWAP